MARKAKVVEESAVDGQKLMRRSVSFRDGLNETIQQYGEYTERSFDQALAHLVKAGIAHLKKLGQWPTKPDFTLGEEDEPSRG